MIKANELRIGNIVGYDGNYDAICGIWNDRIKFGWQGVWNINVADVLPIKLTPEIIAAANFTVNDNSVLETYFSHNEIGEIEHNSEGFWYYVAHGHYLKLEWVHQFQNLCFSLTGKELEINLQTINKCQQV